MSFNLHRTGATNQGFALCVFAYLSGTIVKGWIALLGSLEDSSLMRLKDSGGRESDTDSSDSSL